MLAIFLPSAIKAKDVGEIRQGLCKANKSNILGNGFISKWLKVGDKTSFKVQKKCRGKLST